MSQEVNTKEKSVNRFVERITGSKVAAKDIIQSFLDSIIEELTMGNRLGIQEVWDVPMIGNLIFGIRT